LFGELISMELVQLRHWVVINAYDGFQLLDVVLYDPFNIQPTTA